MASTYEVSRIARTLMNEHGLGQWRFEYDRSTKRFGACYYGSRTIKLSEKLVGANTVERCTETILHEIAHALAGHAAGHGPAWVRQARALGIKGERCYDGESTTLVGNYFGYCARCGDDKPMSSRVQAPTPGFICRKHRTRLVWKDARGRVVEPVAKPTKVYVMTCSCCGVIGTTKSRPRNSQTHRGCGFSVTFSVKKSLDIRGHPAVCSAASTGTVRFRAPRDRWAT